MSETSKPYVAVADWGTSSFRLWILAADGSVLGESRGHDGLVTVTDGNFEAVLERHLAALKAPGDLPVVICGMAGSRAGWVEAPYMGLPAGLDAIADAVVAVPARRRVIMVPGIARRDPSAPDVIRGEETKLFGLVRGGTRDAVVVMPGTHCKWVQIAKGVVADFRTFMTGELFATIKDHTVLAGALIDAGAIDPDDEFFIAGVKASLANPAMIANALFSIRAGWLVHNRSADQQLARLSGLLIGQEIAGGRTLYGGVSAVHLLADERMGGVYHSALRVAGLDVTRIEADELVRDGLFAVAKHVFTGA